MKPLNIAKLDTLSRILEKGLYDLTTIAKTIDNYYIEGSVKKKSGELRILYKPRYILKTIQSNIKRRLSTIKLPDCVHGWVKGKSVKSATEFHRGMKYLYCFDIRSYFDSVRSDRVFRLFAYQLRCSPYVARLLTRLSTYNSCLPQGNPCSPVIANLILFDFDVSMDRFTKRQHARYGRLGDDIILSSNHKLYNPENVIISRLQRYGLRINNSKSKYGTPSVSGIKVLGVVIGSSVTISKKYRQEIKAILHNAKKTGLGAQNHDGRFNIRKHLLGRIALVEMYHPAYGAKLRNELKLLRD